MLKSWENVEGGDYKLSCDFCQPHHGVVGSTLLEMWHKVAGKDINLVFWCKGKLLNIVTTNNHIMYSSSTYFIFFQDLDCQRNFWAVRSTFIVKRCTVEERCTAAGRIDCVRGLMWRKLLWYEVISCIPLPYFIFVNFGTPPHSLGL